MLKGYLLANLEEGQPRLKANDLWRKRMPQLNDQSPEGDSAFLKTWLRSRYSTKIRERKRNARPEGWDRIGTEFHRWLRDNHDTVGSTTREDLYVFVTRELDFYSRQYARLVEARRGSFGRDSGLRFIYFNAGHGFTLQNQLLLAPLMPDDGTGTIDLKLELVARYIDILMCGTSAAIIQDH